MQLLPPLPMSETVLRKWRLLLNAGAGHATGAILIRNTADGVEVMATSYGIMDRIEPEAAAKDVETLLESANLFRTGSFPVSLGEKPFGAIIIADDRPGRREGATGTVFQDVCDAIELDLCSWAKEHACREREAYRTEQVFELAGIGFWEYDLKQQVYHGDEAAHRVLGFDPAGHEITDAMLTERLDAASFQRVKQKRKTAQAENVTSQVYDIEIINDDGERRTLRVFAQNKFDEEGRHVARRGAIQDITAFRRLEAGMSRAERILDLCFEAAGIVIWEYDLSRDVLVFSTATREGASAVKDLVLPADTDLTLERVLEGSHAADHETLKNAVDEFGRGTRETVHFEHRLRRTDGKWTWFLSAGRALQEGAESGTRAYGISVDITALKEAESELREQAAALKKRETLLRFAMRLGRCGAWEYDRETDLLRSSPEASALFDFPPNLEKPLDFYIEMIPEPYRDTVRAAMERTLTEGTDFEIEHPVTRPDGSLSYVRQRAEAVRDEHGRIIGIWAIIQDTTREAREEKRRDLLWGLAKAAFWEYDVKRKVYCAEPRIADLLELPPERFVLTTEQVAELIHPDDRDAYIDAIVKATKRGLTDLVTGCRLLIGGKVKHIRTVLHQEFGTEGKLVARYGINMDVTEEKEAELALRRQEERLRLTTEAAQLGTWEWNPKTGDASASDGWFDMVGFEGEEKPSHIDYWLDNLHPEDKPRVLESLERHFHGGDEVFDTEFRFRNPKKGWIWLHGLGTVMERDSEGEPIRMLGTHQDITEKKEKERRLAQQAEQLRQAQRMEAVGELAGGVAHEFNNLLQVISGYGELLEDCLEDQPEARENLKAIRDASSQGAELVRQLMQFTHKEPVSRGVVHLPGLVSGMIQMLRRVLGENIDLRLHAPTDLPLILADDSQMRQVVMNLCLNARDAIGAKEGRITIHLDRREVTSEEKLKLPAGEYLVLSIADTGAGMSDDVRERIFDPFFTTKEVGEGTGLGLSAVLGIVEYHEGAITVESKPGKGSTFRVFLPTTTGALEEDLPAEEEQDGSEVLPKKAAGSLILVAEDNPFVLELAVDSLAKLGFDTVAARDGAEALELFRRYQDRIELLLFDIIMPRRNGPRVYRDIRNLGFDLPVIFATGYGDTFVEMDPVPAHYAFLAKPFNRRSLEKAIHKVWTAGAVRD